MDAVPTQELLATVVDLGDAARVRLLAYAGDDVAGLATDAVLVEVIWGVLTHF